MTRRTPTALRIINGNRSKRPLPQHEPKPQIASVEPPSWLSTDARRAWRSVAPSLVACGLLTMLDRPVLAAWASAMADFRRADAELQRLGSTGIEVLPSGYAQMSALQLLKRSARADYIRFGALLGMGATNRVGLDVKPATGQPSENDRFFSR